MWHYLRGMATVSLGNVHGPQSIGLDAGTVLAAERSTAVRRELVAGQLNEMVGASQVHNLLAAAFGESCSPRSKHRGAYTSRT